MKKTSAYLVTIQENGAVYADPGEQIMLQPPSLNLEFQTFHGPRITIENVTEGVFGISIDEIFRRFNAKETFEIACSIE